MLLFESSLSSVFWNVLSYSVIRAYSVSDFEKCTTLFRYFSLLCYLELRSTHLLGRAGQLSQVYFTHSALILNPRNLPPTVNKQWPPLRKSRMSRHTRFNTSRKTATAAMKGIFLGTCGTNAVDRSIRPSVRIRFCISIVSKMSKS